MCIPELWNAKCLMCQSGNIEDELPQEKKMSGLILHAYMMVGTLSFFPSHKDSNSPSKTTSCSHPMILFT